MLNQAQIIGHLGKDPEVRYLPSGDPVANFSIATTEKWKDKATGEQREQTEWHRINVFGKLADICSQYLKKGSLVFVQGKITTREWTDKDGIKRYSTEIRADHMKMLGGRSDDQGGQRTQHQPAAAAVSDLEDDIPF